MPELELPLVQIENISSPQLLIFCSIGFSILLALPTIVNVLAINENRIQFMKSQLRFVIHVFEPLSVFFVVLSFTYLLGSIAVLTYFLNGNLLMGQLSFFIPYLATFILLISFFVRIVVSGFTIAVEEIVERVQHYRTII